MSDKFFVLLRLGLGVGTEADCNTIIASEEWPPIFETAQQQAVLGITFDGMTQLRRDNRPPRLLLLQWVALVEQIKQRNSEIDHYCRYVTELLGNVGIDSHIIKGQGIAQLYPHPELRQSGDIDVWVRPLKWDGVIDRSIADIEQRINATGVGQTDEVVFHHLHWHIKTVEVEVHYRPHVFNNPFANRRFMQWCGCSWLPCKQLDGYQVPSDRFNAVYILAHIYRHLLFEGLKMKQVCDYYVLLNQITQTDRDEAARQIAGFGMSRFARGLMWVMGDVFLLEREKMIAEPDEHEGRFIINEILNGGSHWRVRREDGKKENVASRFVRLTKYRSRFLTRYPSEIVWDIPFRLYHYCWRKRYGKEQRLS